MVKTAVVILNYNGRSYLETFLPKVIQYNDDYTVYIADNASTDNSIDFLREHYPTLPLIVLSQNLGFSHGYNEALKQIKAEYYILLNSDVEVTPKWSLPLIQLLENDRAIAACQPKILDYSDKSQFEYAGAAGGFIDYLGYPFCRGRLFDTLEKDTGQYNDTIPIFWATGACLAIRAEVFHALGGFDKDFFAHMEEIDLCWRLRSAGFHVYYCGNSQVFHIGGGTLSKSNPHKTYLNFRNGLTMLYKNTPKKSLMRRMGMRLCLDLIAATKFLLSGSPKDAMAVLKAITHFMAQNSKNKRKRKQQNNSQQHIPEIYPKSIVKAYFIDKKRYFNALEY